MYVLLGNPGVDATTATVTFLLADGTTVDRTYDVPARRRLTINVEDQDPRLRQAEVSVRVVSGEPIVVERAMYWPGNSSTWQDAHNSFGVTETGLAWMLAEGRAGTSSKYETFVLIANPSSAQAAEVTLTFLGENGPPVVRTATVQPNSRFTVWASAIPELAECQFRRARRVHQRGADRGRARDVLGCRGPALGGRHQHDRHPAALTRLARALCLASTFRRRMDRRGQGSGYRAGAGRRPAAPGDGSCGSAPCSGSPRGGAARR